MCILISCWGTIGEVMPFAWLTRDLARQDHQVHVCGPAPFGELFEHAASYTALPPSLDTHISFHSTLARMFSPQSGWETMVAEMIDPFVVTQFETVASRIASNKIEAAFTSWTTPAAALAGETCGIPVWRCYLYPMALFQADDIPVFPRWKRCTGEAACRNANLAASIHRHFRRLSPNLNKVAADLGYAEEEQGMFPLQRHPGNGLALFPGRLLRLPDPGIRHLANHWSSREHKLTRELERFLSEGDPPIVVSLGSLVAWSRPRLFDQTIRACLDAGERVVGIVGDGKDTKHPVSSVLLVEGVPPAALARYSKAIVHHGGINTTLETLANGKPSLCLPQALDQLDNAARLSWLGVGKWIKPSEQECPVIAKALGELSDDARYQETAARWAEERYLECGLSTSEIGVGLS